jgi:anti-sigma factor RsiW
VISVADRHVAGARLSAFLDDELPEDESLRAARHIAGCERCLGELEGLRSMRAALRQLPGLQAPVFTGGTTRRGTRLRALVLAAVLPLAAVLALALLGGATDGVQPTTDLFLVEHLGRGRSSVTPTALDAGR